LNRPFIHKYFDLPVRKTIRLDCGGHLSINENGKVITSKNFEQFVLKNSNKVVSNFAAIKIPTLVAELKSNDQALLAVKVEIPKTAKVGSIYSFDVVQRDNRTNKIIGGIALKILVKEKEKFRNPKSY